MKRIFLFVFVFAALSVSAKKVKFAVNMAAWVVDTAGVHVTGDFQDEAGFAADWDPGTTPMMQDVSDTNIYWVVVDIPAFRVYEFKYVNGEFGYQQEFVPVESRVNYNFIDNRWFYLDSLSNDTLEIGAVRFGGNAPAGKNLIRFYVDMSNETVAASGVRVASSLNNWSTTEARMYSYDGSVWEYIAYADSGMFLAREYKFLNGNAVADYEPLAGWCANSSGNREVVAPRDTMLPTVCFTFCAACSTVGLDELQAGTFSLAPNPANSNAEVIFSDTEEHQISVVDFSGREVMRTQSQGAARVTLPVQEYAAGVYFVRVMNPNGRVSVRKLIVE